MTHRLRTAVLLLLLAIAAIAGAQDQVTWSGRLDRADVRAGETARVVLTATIKQGWHTYSIVPVEKGPFPTTIQAPEAPFIESVGTIAEQKPKMEEDPNFGKTVGLFDGTAEFYVPIKLKSDAAGDQKFAVKLRYMTCDASTCIPPAAVEVPITFAVSPGEARSEYAAFQNEGGSTPPAKQDAGPTDEASLQIQKAQDAGLLPFVIFAFGMGLLSLITPCVFPMIPITVSFFSKQKTEDGKLNYAGPVAYCLGIIGTFTGLGVIMGSTGLNKVATNVWVNLGLGVLFVVLAASLFGVFEIRLPSWLVNKASSKSRSGGLVGPLVMGLTFTLTSFTCTVPFVGTLLATSAQRGWVTSVVGMLAYSTAFALPFFLLALFPSFLSKLPRSGAWLVTVKAYMGFLELMAALKFFSNVDLSFKLGWLTQPVFLAVWAVTAAIGGMYLLGWLRLPHDGDVKVGWFRRAIGVATVGLAILFLGGIEGGPLGDLAAFLPPDPYPGKQARNQERLAWESSYDAALAKAKASGKNVFIDFTGIYCTNCRLIEKNVFPQPEVEKVLDRFVLARLYTDVGTAETDANQKLQLEMTKVNTLPIYVVVSPEGKVLKIHQQQPPLNDADKFLAAIEPFSKGSVVASKQP
jgi:thiol:disulfide interchange protein DsbD